MTNEQNDKALAEELANCLVRLLDGSLRGRHVRNLARRVSESRPQPEPVVEDIQALLDGLVDTVRQQADFVLQAANLDRPLADTPWLKPHRYGDGEYDARWYPVRDLQSRIVERIWHLKAELNHTPVEASRTPVETADGRGYCYDCHILTDRGTAQDHLYGLRHRVTLYDEPPVETVTGESAADERCETCGYDEENMRHLDSWAGYGDLPVTGRAPFTHPFKPVSRPLQEGGGWTAALEEWQADAEWGQYARNSWKRSSQAERGFEAGFESASRRLSAPSEVSE